jgi:hypothetical protein
MVDVHSSEPRLPNQRDLAAEALRLCIRDPIPEIFDAARYLDAAVSAHLVGRRDLAEELIRLADMPAIREWSESIWGPNKEHRTIRAIEGAPSSVSREQRIGGRMPSTEIKKALLERDGYHCRFCGIPVIRETIRRRIREVYPNALPWGRTNATQHAAFQAMWVQYDHILPHARGGDHSFNNMVVTCGPCNFGRMSYLLGEVALIDPRTRDPFSSTWDGLERFHAVRPEQRRSAKPTMPKASSNATRREAFFALMPAVVSGFFAKALDLANARGLEIRFGGKGFSVRAPGCPPFFYCHPPGNLHDNALIEIFLKDLGDSQLVAEMRHQFSRIPSLKVSGKHSFRLPVTQKTVAGADQTLDVSLKCMERQVQKGCRSNEADAS